MDTLVEKFGVVKYFRELGEIVEINDCNQRMGGLELAFPNISPEDETSKTVKLIKGLNDYFKEKEVRRIIQPRYDEKNQKILLSYVLPQENIRNRR